jgi:hypothetical protein
MCGSKQKGLMDPFILELKSPGTKKKAIDACEKEQPRDGTGAAGSPKVVWRGLFRT